MRKLRPHELGRPTPDALAALPRHPIAVLVDDVRSLHNVGSIFRTADAARIEQVVLCGITATPSHPALRKTALGAEASVPWSHSADALTAARAFRARGYRLAVLEQTDAPTRPDALTPGDFPLLLAVGNEVEGVSDALVAEADLAVEIPQYGAKHSLNVSVAFGVAIYGLVERYRTLHPRPE